MSERIVREVRRGGKSVVMARDPVVAEVRCQRDKLAAEFGYDLAAIVADRQTRQRGNRRLVKRRAKRAAPSG
jgi:hypothetical protein